MEEFCRNQRVFFNDNQRIDFQISKSKGLYKEFIGHINRGFKNYIYKEDKHDLDTVKKVMATESKIKDGGEQPTAASS
jgi:trans-2-enoyl-CoA reductase